MYSKVSQIPFRETALVLGTSPKLKSGNANPYFTKRMEAVSSLYHYRKIKKIIVSGEKSKNYDEPSAMAKYLVKNEGIPENIIIKDNFGFNTKQSVIRCKKIYHESHITIISQEFHTLRALFFARNNHIDALGFEAEDVSMPNFFVRNYTREFLAWVKAFLNYHFNIFND